MQRWRIQLEGAAAAGSRLQWRCLRAAPGPPDGTGWISVPCACSGGRQPPRRAVHLSPTRLSTLCAHTLSCAVLTAPVQFMLLRLKVLRVYRLSQNLYYQHGTGWYPLRTPFKRIMCCGEIFLRAVFEITNRLLNIKIVTCGFTLLAPIHAV